MAVVIRPAEEADLSAISRLYYETVHVVNARDYTPEQLDAWAPEILPDTFWRERFRTRQAFVAELDGRLGGFAELLPPGHVDCFYVHHECQRHGIGRTLMSRLESAALAWAADRLDADVSVTARPFFESMGFSVYESREVPRKGQRLRQFGMERSLV